MKAFFIAVLLLATALGFAQSLFTGTVKDAVSGNGLPYVNIGIVDRNVGTVSAQDGTFSINLDEKYSTDIIRISLVGYKNIEMTVASFRKKYEAGQVRMDIEAAQLKEVVIRNFPHTILWGNTKIGRDKVTAGFANNVLGNEMGLLIKATEHPARLEAFHALVADNKYGKLKFRLNVYTVKDGLPDRSLLTESIIVESDIRQGKLTVNLYEYDIIVNGNFFVSLEWIEGLGEGGLHFMADYSGPQLITRATSQGKWNVRDDLSFAFTITAKY